MRAVRGLKDPANPLRLAFSGLRHYGKAVILLSMKATLTITSRGVVTLPSKLRLALGLKGEDQLIAETTPDGLLLRPAVTLPIEIYSVKREQEFDAAEGELAALLKAKQRGRNVPSKAARSGRR